MCVKCIFNTQTNIPIKSPLLFNPQTLMLVQHIKKDHYIEYLCNIKKLNATNAINACITNRNATSSLFSMNSNIKCSIFYAHVMIIFTDDYATQTHTLYHFHARTKTSFHPVEMRYSNTRSATIGKFSHYLRGKFQRKFQPKIINTT